MKLDEIIKESNEVYTFGEEINIHNIHQIDPDKKYDVHCEQSVYLAETDLQRLPITFTKVDENFNVKNSSIASTFGFPAYVGFSYNIGRTSIHSLEGGPEFVGSDYFAISLHLKSLKGIAKTIGGDLFLNHSNLKELDYLPERIGGDLNLAHNGITSLCGIHKKLKACQEIFLKNNPIKEGGIGLLLIENLERVVVKECSNEVIDAFTIINKYLHLGNGKASILECQEELEDAGLEAFAKL